MNLKELLLGKTVAENVRYKVIIKNVITKKLYNNSRVFFTKVLFVRRKQPLLGSIVYAAEPNVNTLMHMRRMGYISFDGFKYLFNIFILNHNRYIEPDLTPKELEAVDEYKYLVNGDTKNRIFVTDNREDGKQWYLKISDDEYVYFEHIYDDELQRIRGESSSDIIYEDHIHYRDMTEEDIKYASDTFDFKNKKYCEADKKHLTMELHFESNLG